MTRTPVIGVMGGAQVPEPVKEQAYELGAAIAAEEWILLNGGRSVGVMGASAQGANEAGGFVVGVLPGRDPDAAGVSDALSTAIATGMGDGRNVINVLSSDVVVACRGGAGTLSETALAVKTGRPLVLLDWPHEEVPGHLETATVSRADSVDQVIARIGAMLRT